MLALESFVHKNALADIIGRWMLNKPEPDDVRRLKTVVNFNLYIARIWVDYVARDLLVKLHGVIPRRMVAKTKGQFKDFAVEHPNLTNRRIEELRERYRKYPEDFYRETPIDGAFYVMDVGGEPVLAGCTRIKRFRRIADKGSRRIVDYMLAEIRAKADELAEERARKRGISKEQLISPKDEMVEEFKHAERRFIKSIKQGTLHGKLPVLSIPDVVGLKLIIEAQDYPRLLEVIERSSRYELYEAETHRGKYNAVNLKVGCRLPISLLLERPPAGDYLKLLEFRGFDVAGVGDAYREFLRSAEPTVMLEIIVSSFEEYLESEIGRSMHEERVLSQRSHPDYNGHLATNARYLMQYILAVCRSAGMPTITDVPIKLWVKYMPETIELLIRRLYLPDELFFGTGPEPLWLTERDQVAPAAAPPPGL